MPEITETFLSLLVKLLELSADLRNTRLDHIAAALHRIEKRQLFEVEALKALLRGQADEATIAALTQRVNAEAEEVKAAVEAQVPPNS